MKRLLRFAMLLICLAGWLVFTVNAVSDSTVNEVQTASGEFTESRSAACGETLRCRAFVSAEEVYQSGGTLHGALSSTLRFVSLLRLTRSGEAINSAFYTLAVGTREDGCAFEIHFPPAFCETLSPGETIEAEYTVSLEGGECSECCVYAARQAKAAKVKSFSLSFFRGVCAVGENDCRHPLYGALYELHGADGARLRFYREADGTYRICTAAECTHGHHVSILRTPENGMLCLRGLAAGEYGWEEKRPPAGYASAGESLTIEIGEDGTVTAPGTPREGETLLLLNHSSALLPAARREDGLLRFYALGCRVLLAMAALIVTERTLLRKYE